MKTVLPRDVSAKRGIEIAMSSVHLSACDVGGSIPNKSPWKIWEGSVGVSRAGLCKKVVYGLCILHTV